MAAEKTASATDLAAAPATTTSVHSQLALASYLYQNGLLEANVNDRNEKALGATNPKPSAFNAIAARDLLVAMAFGGIRGALADPPVDSKKFVVGDLKFRADTLATPALTTSTTDPDFYRRAGPMANAAAAITGQPVIARVVDSTPRRCNQLHFYATDDAVKNTSGKRTATATILDLLRSPLPHLTAAPVLNYYHANSTVVGPLLPHVNTLMVTDHHFASALEDDATGSIGTGSIPATHDHLADDLIQHSSSTAPHLTAASATTAVGILTHELPMNTGSAPLETPLPIRTHAGPAALFSPTQQASRTTLIPARRRSGPTVRRTHEPVLVEEVDEEESPAMPPSTVTRRVTEQLAGPTVAFTLATDSRGRAHSALPAVAVVSDEDEDGVVEHGARPTTMPTVPAPRDFIMSQPDAPFARGLAGPRTRPGTRHAPEPPRPAAAPHFSLSRLSRAPFAALVEEAADEEKELIPHTQICRRYLGRAGSPFNEARGGVAHPVWLAIVAGQGYARGRGM
ncbi:hypothetical protein AMAG_17078 [Allomyces macrogynus ATCC 38327]|uniref:Uncharacterized protein n=1 Tax=Allomyces macrogynus (strain ATCC 38327) TaxID=578462 RepID=A0A0L0TDU1_ALLM3|nr:hypothetical protein AMAG_17078 [Allomyces macrogynus ATCC 38327]|eukprot:KNE72749.1 hypothetical protein AMAG_17078 [Allomyces macrogynus ATCC 38327]